MKLYDNISCNSVSSGCKLASSVEMGQLPEEVNILIFVISIFLALLGMLFNGTSLSFFLTRGKQVCF